ncbi:MAG: FMN-binding protein [Candidatus Saccharimonadales bacterium]
MNIKKSLIGLAVLAVFVIYSLGIRHQQPRVSKPASLTTNNNPASSNNPATNSAITNPSASAPAAKYKDGTYTGSVANAYYGNIQVKTTVSGGKITNVKFLQYPDTHQTSVYINQQAMPYLQQEAIKTQSPNVNIISGATFTSQAFQQSLASALSQANA